ncbi:MAG TPA: DUF3090 family protein [Microthrixaceae bacterium]|nr:DUF3090 domain-containing protein [Microthrixaceae bacterium]HNI35839.1 DUF3090 family protein [Microthrixaceae bacterium]
MSSSFDLSDVDSFATGTEGPAGQRVFYLQAVAGHQVVTLRLEKQQVALLADYLARVVASSDFVAGEPTAMPAVVEPLIPEWTVGSMMVAIDEARARVIVIAEEMTIDDGDPDAAPTGSQARFSLTRDQVDAFVAGAQEIISAGRPTCPLCGRPMDIGGHFCPRLN